MNTMKRFRVVQAEGRHERLDSSTESIPDFAETTIYLKKEKTGLGISIVGGCDTHLGKVLVNAINSKGAAGKDGRLEIGDQLVLVNGVELGDVTHQRAVQLLRLAKNPVRLTIYRDNIEKLFTSLQEPNREFTVTIKKRINDTLGLGLYARKDGNGLFITYIVQNSLADRVVQLQQGDQILECNGKNLRHTNQQDSTHFFKNLFGDVRLLIGRNEAVQEILTKLKENLNSAEVMDGTAKVERRRSLSSCAEHRLSEYLHKKPRSASVAEFLNNRARSDQEKNKEHTKSIMNDGYQHEDMDSFINTTTIKVILNEEPLRNWPVLYDEPETRRNSIKAINPNENKSSRCVSFEMQDLVQQQLKNPEESHENRKRPISIGGPFDDYYGKLLGRQWKGTDEITIISSQQ